SLHLRARAMVAGAVKSNEPGSMLAMAERDAKQIEGEKMAWGNALALLIRAGIAATRNSKQEALSLLDKAESSFEQADMKLHKAAARACRGRLIAGAEGEALLNDAYGWMQKQK